jgi:hypothetical protein
LHEAPSRFAGPGPLRVRRQRSHLDERRFPPAIAPRRASVPASDRTQTSVGSRQRSRLHRRHGPRRSPPPQISAPLMSAPLISAPVAESFLSFTHPGGAIWSIRPIPSSNTTPGNEMRGPTPGWPGFRGQIFVQRVSGAETGLWSAETVTKSRLALPPVVNDRMGQAPQTGGRRKVGQRSRSPHRPTPAGVHIGQHQPESGSLPRSSNASRSPAACHARPTPAGVRQPATLGERAPESGKAWPVPAARGAAGLWCV